MSKVINIESVKDTTLYKMLLSRNNEETKAFVANIPEICNEASDRATQIPKFFSEYTLHDKTHFIRVTELMSYVLGSGVKELNDIEIGLLILAAFCHDQGMFIEKEEYKTLQQDENYLIFRDNWFIDHANYKEIKKQLESSFISTEEKERLSKIIGELDGAMLTDFLRESHGQRSHDYVLSKFGNERILSVSGTNISNYLAKICLSHAKSIDWITVENGLNYDENIGTYSVNTIFLSIVLRLADILDFDSDRTPDVLFKSIHFTSPVSIAEWQKHRDIKGWEISKDLVRFTMYFEHPVYEKTAHVFLDSIDRELTLSHNLIRKFPSKVSRYQIDIAEKVDRTRLGPKNNSYLYHDLEFNLSRDEIVKLLMTDKLYKNTSLFIRELLQNSLDALRLRKAIHQKDGFEWNTGKIFFRHYIDAHGQQVVECNDNGCGMDEEIISKFLGKVGRSFYRSPEFERQRIQLKEKGVDFEPCSQFGIGFMSCFMVGDRIQILTRKDYGHGKQIGKPLIIEINGLGGLIVIKEANDRQEPGTTVRIFCRQKPLLFDDFSDNIQLLTTLEGYAIATEFPIKAACMIEEIKGEIDIPITIEKKKTFLESLELNNKRTFEIDLTEVNKNLSGFLRQTFLIDAKELPCIENNEGKWEIKIDKRRLDKDDEKFKKIFLIKPTNQKIEYNYHYSGLSKQESVSIDGILVCGYPGRSEYSEMDMAKLGYTASRISSEHIFSMDVRGNIKPELNPAREPLDNGSMFNTPIGWKYIQNLVNRGSGNLWKQILNLSDEGLSAEIFWKLIIIYGGRPLYINSNSLSKHLKLPIESNNWINLSEIKSFSFDTKSIIAIDDSDKGYSIQFSNEIINWSKTLDTNMNLNYWLSNLLICLSKFELNRGNIELAIRTTFKEEEIPSDNCMSKELSSVRFIPFAGFSKDYITTTKFINIANSENPIVKLVLNSRYMRQKDELTEFASAFVFNICYLIQKLSEDKKPFTTQVNLRPLTFASILFKNIDWSKYSDDLKPPYKIFIDSTNTVEINQNDFEYWSKQKYRWGKNF